VVPNRRIVFTWSWDGDKHPVPPGSSSVEIGLLPEAAGTRQRLTHRGLVTTTRAGNSYLARLVVVAQAGYPSAR
jgi:uncharacterized protein YndB with AHSA1/START domain